MKTFFTNGKCGTDKKATVSIFDLGFLRGFGVFDLAAIYDGRIFCEKEHLERLKNSARLLKLKLPYSISEIFKIDQKLIAKNKTQNGIIRWVLTGGVSQTHFVKKENFLVLVEDEIKYPRLYYYMGVKVITTGLKRELPEVKSINYQIAYSHYPLMKKAGAFEMIYTPENSVLEATTSNFFLVKDGTVISAKDDVLPGITRQIVINLCRKNKIPISMRSVKKSELKNCDEAFLSATTKKILPVTKIDDYKVGTGKPGPLTQNLIELFEQFIIRWGPEPVESGPEDEHPVGCVCIRRGDTA